MEVSFERWQHHETGHLGSRQCVLEREKGAEGPASSLAVHYVSPRQEGVAKLVDVYL